MEKSCIICFDETPLIPHINTFCKQTKEDKYCSCNFHIHSHCLRKYLKKFGDVCTMCRKQFLLKKGIVEEQDDLIVINVDNNNDVYTSLSNNEEINNGNTIICNTENKQICMIAVICVILMYIGSYLLS